MFSAKLLNAQQQGLTNPLFGGGSSTAAQPAPGTNPFTTNPGIAQPAAGTNVFGGAAQPASGGNLFGGTAQSSTNIFGAPAQTAAPGTGMFGGTTQQAPPGTNIFGAPAGNQPQTGQQQINTSLFQPTFGATQTQQTAASAQQQQQQPGLGASFFGNPQQQQLQQQQQQGQQQANSNPFASFSPFKPTTSQPQTGSSLWGNNTFGASVAPKQPYGAFYFFVFLKVLT